jgi:hypothetical protein
MTVTGHASILISSHKTMPENLEAALLLSTAKDYNDALAASAANLGTAASSRRLASHVSTDSSATDKQKKTHTADAEYKTKFSSEFMGGSTADASAPHKFHKMKEHAMEQNAGSMKAACKQEGADAANCDDLAKEEVEGSLGGRTIDDTTYNSAVKPKVDRISDAIEGGMAPEDTPIQQVGVHIETKDLTNLSKSTCSTANMETLKSSLQADLSLQADQVTVGHCLPGSGGGSVHKLYVDCGADCDTKAAEVNTALASTSAMLIPNALRRLSTASESVANYGATQDAALCAPGQTDCSASVFTSGSTSGTNNGNALLCCSGTCECTSASVTTTASYTGTTFQVPGTASDAGRVAIGQAVAALIMMLFFSS